MDGFCDVIDAKSSYGNKEKRLEIMSDPHTGAFAVIYAAIYFLVQTGLFSEVRTFENGSNLRTDIRNFKDIKRICSRNFKKCQR